MAAYLSFVGHVVSWMVGKGIPDLQAREYVASMLVGILYTGAEAANRTFEEIVWAHATPGGLNEQVLRDLTGQGVFETLTKALESVHRRAAGQSS